jgi:hypothetical protein
VTIAQLEVVLLVSEPIFHSWPAASPSAGTSASR